MASNGELHATARPVDERAVRLDRQLGAISLVLTGEKPPARSSDAYLPACDEIAALLREVKQLRAFRDQVNQGEPSAPAVPERIATPCPACGLTTVMVMSGGYLTCSALECTNPTLIHDLAVTVKQMRYDRRVYQQRIVTLTDTLTTIGADK